MSEESDDFDAIVQSNNLEDWFKETQPHVLTIADVYEGIAILSSVQVDLHQYLNEIISALFANNRAGEEVQEVPRLTKKQVSHLQQVFESAATFLEEQDI